MFKEELMKTDVGVLKVPVFDAPSLWLMWGGGQLRPGQAGGLRWADPGQAADPDQLIRDAVRPDERL